MEVLAFRHFSNLRVLSLTSHEIERKVDPEVNIKLGALQKLFLVLTKNFDSALDDSSRLLDILCTPYLRELEVIARDHEEIMSSTQPLISLIARSSCDLKTLAWRNLQICTDSDLIMLLGLTPGLIDLQLTNIYGFWSGQPVFGNNFIHRLTINTEYSPLCPRLASLSIHPANIEEEHLEKFIGSRLVRPAEIMFLKWHLTLMSFVLSNDFTAYIEELRNSLGLDIMIKCPNITGRPWEGLSRSTLT